MEKEEIFLSDINRILFGQAPPEFLIEVFFRTLILYLILLAVIRLLGNRMNAQLSILEMAIMLTLGAIVSVPMQTPDRGILQGILLLVCTMLFHRGINALSFIRPRFEALTLNVGCTLIKDGVLQIDEIKKAGLSHQLIFSELRRKKINHLGQVKRLYLEATGGFSVFLNQKKKPGLSTFPIDDPDIFNVQPSADSFVSCALCGNTLKKTNQKCPNCGECRWTKSIGEIKMQHETGRN